MRLLFFFVLLWTLPLFLDARMDASASGRQKPAQVMMSIHIRDTAPDVSVEAGQPSPGALRAGERIRLQSRPVFSS